MPAWAVWHPRGGGAWVLGSNYMYKWGHFSTQCCPGLMNAKHMWNATTLGWS